MDGISDNYGASYSTGYEYGREKRKADTAGPEEGVNEWMDAIAKRKEEIVEKVRKGETEPSIPIGAASFTYKQWNKLMKSVDRAIDAMQERIRAEEEDAEPLIKKKKENSITEEMLEELLGIKIQRGKVFHGGELSSQIGGGERIALDNAYYSIQPEGDGLFSITDKKTGLVYKFAEEGCSLRQDRASGRMFLIPGGAYEQMGSILEADSTLVSMMAQYFGVDSLKAGILTGYSFETNQETGIEIMIRDGMKGRSAHILFRSGEDMAAYECLVQTYRREYPNLVQSDEMAEFYAALEIEGLCRRTETGILYTHAGGVGYADENNPDTNWWIALDEESDENYEMLMEMMEEIEKKDGITAGINEWKSLLERRKADYKVIESDKGRQEFIAGIKSLTIK